ncbi:hypothetical protein ALQ51_02772, partial [Pseudomonas cannabina]
SAVTYVAICVVSAIAVKKLSCDAPRRHPVLDALRPLCGAERHTAVLRGQLDMLSTQGTFSPLGE